MRLVIALTVVAIVATLVPGEALELQRGGEPWRVVTCHFTHWTHEQLVWDGLAFAALGIACARRNRQAFHTTLLASVFVVPAAVFLFSAEIDSYRGLSGIASAMFALLLVDSIRSERRPWLATVVALAFFAKIAFETVTGSAIFVQDLGEGVVAVPVAHLA